MKTGKKLLALLLAVVMTMSMMTVGAFAEEPVDETQNSVEEPQTPAPETPVEEPIETDAAKIVHSDGQETVYTDATAAFKALKDGETVQLLADYTASDWGLRTEAKDITIDLNGCNITCTKAKNSGYALKVEQKYGSAKDNTVIIKNSNSAKQSVLTSYGERIRCSSGNSEFTQKIVIDGEIAFQPYDGGVESSISLGSGAKLAYSKSAADAVANGHFKADESDGAYIYGSVGAAVKADVDGTVELLNDYVGTSELTLCEGTLDLAGHTYEYKYNSEITTSTPAAINAYNNDEESMTVKNGKIVTNSYAASLLNANKSLVLDGVVMEAGYGIETNGSAGNINNHLTMKNSSLTVKNSVGIYFPSAGSVEIIDSTIHAVDAGVQMCSGSLLVSGENTSITATGADHRADKIGDGSIPDGAAISLVNRNYPGGAPTATIENGKFDSKQGAAVSVYTWDGSASEWKDANLTISGGTFSSDVSDYLADGYVQNANGEVGELEQVAVAEATTADGVKKYATLKEAVEKAGDNSTITLLKDTEGAGIVIDTSKKNLTIDFNTHSYTVSGSTVGSSGTETNAFQFLTGGSLTLKNGSVIFANKKTLLIGLQNYCNLTLEDMVIDASQADAPCQYAISNNCGTVQFIGNTSIKAYQGQKAFDSCKFGGYEIPTVKVNTTGTITGDIELSGGKLEISAGTFEGEIHTIAGYTKGDAVITGGKFSSTLDESYLAEGYVQNANGEVGRLDQLAVAEVTTADGSKTTKYETLQKAIAAAESGDTVKLLKTVTNVQTLTLDNGNTINLNLNGFDLKFATDNLFKVTHGVLNLTGQGMVESSHGNNPKVNVPVLYAYGGETDEADHSVITIGKDVTVQNLTGYGIGIGHTNFKAYGAKVVIAGQVKAKYGFSVTGNAKATTGSNLPEIVVEQTGSIYSSDGGAIYAAGYAKYNVAGSLEGKSFGIEIRAGELTVEDTATITASGAFSNPVPNGNGFTVTGAAIAVSQHTTNLPIKVEIKGGNISETGTNGYALYEIDTVKDEAGENVAKEVSISVTGGTFSGGVHSTNNKLSISGGYFTSDPGAYVADGYAAVSNDDARYIYKVVAAEDETPVKPAVKEPEVKTEIQGVDETTKQAIEAAAKSVEVPALGAEAAKVAVSDGEKTAAVDAAVKVLGEDKKDDIIVYTQAYLDIVTTGYEKTGENVSVTMDITPKVQLVASTAKTGDGIVLEGDQKNAVTYGNPEELTISGPTVVTVRLPEATFGDKAVFIKHEASKGTYFYKATAAADGTITFTSHHGFSPFTFSTANEAVAEIGEIGYPTLKAAIDAAKDNDTITLLKDCNETVTISWEISFKLEKAAGVNFTGKIEAGYRYSVSEKDGTYTVTYVGGGSSGGGSSSSSGRYTVKVDSGKHGEVKVSSKRADKGDTITITVDPDKGYVLDELTVTDKDGDTVKVKSKSDTKFTFTMPASDVTVEATFTAEKEETLPFADIPEDFWAVKEITWAYGKGYMNGVSADQFAPGRTVTRQQLWMVLARLAGEKPADMTAARQWAVENGVSDGSNPGGALTRQQMVTILYRYAKLMGYDATGSADLTVFPDHASVADYAKEAMAWSVKNEIVGGTAQGTLNPAGTATRAQFAVILYRFCGNVL